jgi:hypothetical protein
MKLFWSKNRREHWVAFSLETGLVIFPAEMNGWYKRQPANDVLAEELREIPLRVAAGTGMPVVSARKRRRKAA